MKPRRTLSQMADGDKQPMTIAGRPADKCPYCGCGMFVDGTRKGETVIFRYVVCRNCNKTFKSKQPPATLVREIEDDDELPSRTGQHHLTPALKLA